jgi:hypothetical protein
MVKALRLQIVTHVTAISASGTGTLGIGAKITFTLTTDNAVTVTGTPELVLSNGAHAVYAGSDSNGYPTFTYIVAEGDTGTADLKITGLDTTGGTIDGPEEEIDFEATSVGVGAHPREVIAADVNSGFTGQTEITVSRLPSALDVADVNGDGNLDMIVANLIRGTVMVMLGDG